MRYLFVPSHTIWLPSEDDVKARLAVSKNYLQRTGNSLIGFEAVQRESSPSKTMLESQVSKTKAIRNKLASEGAEALFSVHTPYTPIEEFNLASGSAGVRRRAIECVKKCVELAEDIGAPIVNTHLGGVLEIVDTNFKDPSVKKLTLERVKESLADIISSVEGRGVTISVENVPYPLEEILTGYSPVIGIFAKDFVEIVRDIDSKHLGVTVDFCHLWITYKTLREFVAIKTARSPHKDISTANYIGLTSYESDAIESFVADPFGNFVRPLGQWIVHIHLADSDGVYIPREGKVSEGLPLGDGDLNLGTFAKWLREIGRLSVKQKRTMIVLETKEANLNNPANSFKSLIRLDRLMRDEAMK
jgi:sugar phosphate isomerase/epimerase